VLWWLQLLFAATASASAAGTFDAALTKDNAVGARAPPLRQSVDLQVPVPPEPVRTAAGTQLVYELHITNFTTAEVDLTRIAVLNAAVGGHGIREFRDAELAGLIGHPGAPSDAGKPSIPPGMRVVVYIGLMLNA